MKRHLLFATILICTVSVRSQNVANTWWLAYDSTNTPGIYWHFDSDTLWFSVNGIDYDSVSTFTESTGQFFVTDIPYPGPNYCPGLGTYNKVFNGDTLWLPVVNDTCPTRDDYLATHYYINITSTVDDVSNRVVKLFPNPTSGTFTVISDQPADKITITDITGRIIVDQRCNSNVSTFDLAGAPAGIYFVRTFIGDQILTQRIIRE